MKHSALLGALVWVCLPWLSLSSALKIQADRIRSVPDAQARAETIRDTFKRGWRTYRAHAWGHDEIGALSLKPTDTRNGWGATIVDSLSTIQLMELSEEYAEALEHVRRIDFTRTNTSVSVFESAIRYVGGLLSAYEASPQTDPILIKKAVELADQLMYAWQHGSILPFGRINFTNHDVYSTKGGNVTNLAEAGSLLIEFHKLSKYSHNNSYFDAAEAGMKAMMRNKPIWPGLHSVYLDPMDARPIAVSWGPAADSFYEYLNKYSLLTGNIDSEYLEHWALAVDSSIKHLIRTSAATTTAGFAVPFFSSKSAESRERTYLASRATRGKVVYGMSHLDCFVGGNWMLGGRMLQNETIVQYGLELTETCTDSYFSTRSGVGPEVFHFIDKKTRATASSSVVDLNFYDRHGFIPSGGYYLRPEVIESMFYAYRITGDSIWQDRAWKAWQAIEQCCQVSQDTGLFAWISDANRVPSRDFAKALRLQHDGPDGWEDSPFREEPEYGDNMESFWWAETLKYFYLIFADPQLVNLNENVFTTEAHPFKIENAWTDLEAGGRFRPPRSVWRLIFENHDSSGNMRSSFLMGTSLIALAYVVLKLVGRRRASHVLLNRRSSMSKPHQRVP